MKVYLGDGVYVEPERGMLKLTTGAEPTNPYTQPSNTIYLEPEVYAALVKYVAMLLTVKVKESE